MSDSYVLRKYANQPLRVAVADPMELDAEDEPRKGLLGHSIPGDLAALAQQTGFVLTCGACLYTPE